MAAASVLQISPSEDGLFRFGKALELFCRRFSTVGMVIFMVMVCMTFFDVFMRYLFNRSFNGTVEVTELLMVTVVFSSMAYAQWTKSHVIMDVLTAKLSERHQTLLGMVTNVWSVAAVAAAVYATCQYASRTTSSTGILGLPIWPFIYLTAFGLGLLVLTLAQETALTLVRMHRGMSPREKVLYTLAAVLPVVLGCWLASDRIAGISPALVGLAGIMAMFVLFFSGMPVAFALMATGLVFIGPLRGLGAGMNMYGKAMYATSASYTWAPLMFFMLMGYLCFYGEFGRDIYACARRWLGHLRGGLAICSVCACTLFGAVVGDALSGSIAVAAIALPEMRENKYNDALAVGTLACSGTIGCLIPPSTMFILYGVLAEQSIGDLFMAGVFPGILCMLIFMFIAWFIVVKNPSKAPLLPPAPMAERLRSLSASLPIVALFVLVIGGIYGGIFTPTEGGGVGAFGTFLLALVMRRLTFEKLCLAFNDSARYITMCFTVLTGATVFAYFMTLSRIPQLLASNIAMLDVSPMLVMLAIVVVLCFLGCFIPAMPLLLICVPIFVPIARVFHWDLIWFGVIMTLLMNMATITPPFGISLFVMKGLAEVPLGLMYRASIPFVIGLGVTILLVVMFPSLSIWLPAIMR